MKSFIERIEVAINKIPNKEIFFLLGDFNAKIGSSVSDNHLRQVVGKFGLGDRNDRGGRLIQFCLDNNFAIVNSMFEHHKGRLYTWRSPDGNYENQIDYILLRQDVINLVLDDHRLLMCEYSTTFKNCRRIQIRKRPQLNVTHVQRFNDSVMSKIEPLIQGIENDSPEKI